MSKRSNKGTKSALENIKKEDVVQAVVVIDSFNNVFDPITYLKPTVLFPMVNTPLLDYTLEMLALSRVQEAILFCSSHTDAVKSHVKKSKWAHRLSPMAVKIIVSESCRSFGDAMRDLDAKGVINSDFILLCGDTVGNLNLLPILQHHKAVQKKDKGAVMTLVYKRAAPGNAARVPESEALLVTRSDTNRILFHQRLQPGTKKLTFPLELFAENPDVEVRYDLLDTHIAVCSAAVPPLFADNFDFQSRDDLVRDLLVNEEILTSTMYCHELGGAEYAARVASWPAYQAVSHDVLHRWTYPLVPDMVFSDLDEPCMFLRNHVYKHASNTVAKGCLLEEDVALASGTSIGEKSCISRSVIGKNCRIGKNVEITDSFIWDSVVIEDGCSVKVSVVCEGCVLREGAQLSAGCVLAPGVLLDPGARLEGACVVASPATTDRDFRDEHELERLGEQSFVVRAVSHVSDSEDEVADALQRGLRLSLSEENSFDSESESSSSEMSYRTSPVPDDTNLFFSEVLDSLSRGYEDRLQCDNLVLEVNSSRYAYNVTVQEVNYHVVKAVLSMPPPESYLPGLRQRLQYFAPLLANYVRNEQAQLDCLQAIEDTASSNEMLKENLVKLLKLLYDKDILGEDMIVKWYKTPNEDSPSALDLRKKVSSFIQWLQEAEEESD
ncbi:translation initiation factor eIF2B subunit epsilon [Bacillus rossius redtenbacheri]|uniref:translation initiation factor eIF2B subunit epsilon n=1 Tax=Bacillus rossius redtenbacheri TaxID=93214 RepID=UPI002FDECCD0